MCQAGVSTVHALLENEQPYSDWHVSKGRGVLSYISLDIWYVRENHPDSFKVH